MERLLVTGGAGFIGSNFVHHLVDHTDAEVTVLDKLTYAAIRESLAGLPDGPGRARRRRHRRRRGRRRRWSPTHDAVVHFAAESHNDNSLDDPRPVHPDQHRRHVHAARGGPQARRAASTTSPPTRSTATSSSTTRSGSPRTRRTTRAAPYSAAKAGSDHLVRAWVRSFGVRATISQLLQQLRALAAHREVHPAPDHQRHRRQPAASSTARARTSATGSTPTTTPPPC